jgi:hypothetical protein
MKETVFLVHIKEKGYIKNVTNNGEWIFTDNLKYSLKFRTITGAYIRLVESKKNPELFDLNGSIIVVEFYEDKFNVLSKLNYILSKDTKFTDEKNKRLIPSVPKEDRAQLSEGFEPKKRRGRPPKQKNIIEEHKETDKSNLPKKTANKVLTNNIVQNKTEEPLVKKKENKDKTIETKIVESDLNVTILKTSTENSFWG